MLATKSVVFVATVVMPFVLSSIADEIPSRDSATFDIDDFMDDAISLNLLTISETCSASSLY